MQQFADIEVKLHSLQRISILEHLIKNANVTFSELLEITQLSPGNLYSHCQTLEKSSYIVKDKVISGNRPLTIYNITLEGLNSVKFYSLQITTYFKHLIHQINLSYEHYKHKLPPFGPYHFADPEGHQINLIES